MPTFLTPDVLALVDVNFGTALRAQIGHLPCACSRPRAMAVAQRSGVAVAVHFLWFCGFVVFEVCELTNRVQYG